MRLPFYSPVTNAGTPFVETLASFRLAFFDRAAVVKDMKPKERAVMSKFGAFVRTRAQSSMLRHVIRRGFGVHSKITDRAGSSEPGQPPFVHTGLLVKFLFFAYDEYAHSVVVGPAATNQVFFSPGANSIHAERSRGVVPGVLERGGAVTVMERQRQHGPDAGEWVRADLRSPRRLAGAPIRFRTVRIAARPYMGPALDAELPKFLPLFGTMGVNTRVA